jgi:O-antigen ligase
VVVALAGRFLAGFHPRRRVSLSQRRKLSVAAVAAVAALGAVIAIDPIERFDTFRKPPDEFKGIETDFTRAHLLSGSGSGRWQFWEAAADQFQEHPLAGAGAGSYESWWARNGDLYRFIRDAHSVYLETLGELGVIGFLLLMGALGMALSTGFVRLRGRPDSERVLVASLLALVVAWCVAAGIDWMWELTVVTVVAVAALALLTGAATARAADGAAPEAAAPGRRDGRRPVLWRPLAVRALVVAAAVLVIATQAIPLLTHKEIRDSQVAAQRGDARDALDSARDSRDLQPWASSPHLQLALVEEQTGDVRAARDSIIDAIDNDPTDWRLWLVRARLETKSARVGPALRSLRRAERLNPRSPLFAPQEAR